VAPPPGSKGPMTLRAGALFFFSFSFSFFALEFIRE
jgi:hypothetical protein